MTVLIKVNGGLCSVQGPSNSCVCAGKKSSLMPDWLTLLWRNNTKGWIAIQLRGKMNGFCISASEYLLSIYMKKSAEEEMVHSPPALC